MPTHAPLLELNKISKRFGAVQALTDVDFEVDAGEVVALVGDNGAGKSTLIKMISGIVAADAGTYRFEDRIVRVDSPQAAAALGIATVYQDLALCDNLDVVANLFLGREEVGGVGLLDETDMEQQATKVLDAAGGADPQRPHPGRLPLGRPAPVGSDRPVDAGRSPRW